MVHKLHKHWANSVQANCDGDEVLDLVHLFLLKKLLCICTVGFCDQVSSWSSLCGWTEELCKPTIFLVGVWSCVLGSAQLVSHVLGSRASERGTISTTYWFIFMSYSLIYVFIVCCLESRIYFIYLYFFSTHVVMHFV